MKTKFTKLINVKSIVTIMLSIVFCVMTVCGKISSEQFMMVFTTVIAFYFGTQHQKNCEENSEAHDKQKYDANPE